MSNKKINESEVPQHSALASKHGEDVDTEVSHTEDAGGRLGTSKDVDVAMSLFDHPDQIHEPRDPEEERRLVRKIDLMILPYLAVCYAFFYIDKTTLSYAGALSILELRRFLIDLILRSYIWYTPRSQFTRRRLQLAQLHVLLWLFVLGFPHQLHDAEVSNRKVPWRQHLHVG